MLHSDLSAHGGSLRRHRCGRRARPLSSYKPLHLVFKSNYRVLRTPKRFLMVQRILQRYALMFRVRIEQVSVQGNHIHLMIRTTRRSKFQAFFRVVAGQIPQHFEKEGVLPPKTKVLKRRSVTGTPQGLRDLQFWEHRPFTRIVRSRRDRENVRDYIRLNELEALGVLPYREQRLKGLSIKERRELLWVAAG
jgi:putative transposase